MFRTFHDSKKSEIVPKKKKEEKMFAKLIVSGSEALAAGPGCYTSGPIPDKGNCIDVGWFPVVGICKIGALKGGT